jgi:hypothetical protein
VLDALICMATYPAVSIELCTEDAVVLFDWLQSTDLNLVPAEHRAVKQALTDLYSRLEEIVPYEFDLTAERVAAAQHEVSKDMGW